jgi:hypothetical protein
MNCLGVTLKTDKGYVLVHLGPAWYIDQQQLTVKEGDTLKVTGSKIIAKQRTMILGRKIEVNGHTLTLRNEQGFPAWRGMRGGGRRWAD